MFSCRTVGAPWHLVALLEDNKSVLSDRARRSVGAASQNTASLLRHLPLCWPRSGHKVLSYSHQTVWLETPADVTVFVWFCLPAHSFLWLLCLVRAGCQGAWHVSFLKAKKKKKKRGLWKRSLGLGSCIHELAFFYFLCLYSQKYKVNKVWSKWIYF